MWCLWGSKISIFFSTLAVSCLYACWPVWRQFSWIHPQICPKMFLGCDDFAVAKTPFWPTAGSGGWLCTTAQHCMEDRSPPLKWELLHSTSTTLVIVIHVQKQRASFLVFFFLLQSEFFLIFYCTETPFWQPAMCVVFMSCKSYLDACSAGWGIALFPRFNIAGREGRVLN